ncbi:MAG: patatin-like phospholipase family protein [Bacteroidota bacterium]
MLDSLLHRLRAWSGSAPQTDTTYALALSGGGARAAYQAGVLQYIAESFPHAHFEVTTGVSAGAINTAHLANYPGAFPAAATSLADSWSAIRTETILEPASNLSLLRRIVPWPSRGGADAEDALAASGEGALIDTTRLRAYLNETLHAENGFLTQVTDKIQAGTLKACAVITTNYMTGQTVVWVQGADVSQWERPKRIGINTAISVDHIMASTALPFLFPAIRIGDAWYGDGGIRLTAPLSPAIHLGADRILAISTRYQVSRAEADQPTIAGYPPMAQIMGQLMNAIFLDTLDQDARMLERINALIETLPPAKRAPWRPLRLLLLRPSCDIGKLAGEHDVHLSGPLGFFSRGVGSEQTRSPDWLSMLLFEPSYVGRLLEIGYGDARRQHGAIEAFLEV